VNGLCCYGNITRTRNVSEYMLVLVLCLVYVCECFYLLRSEIAQRSYGGHGIVYSGEFLKL